MNKNLDFLNKTEVNTFVYSTINESSLDCKTVHIDGREYTKWGHRQIVTFVGMMYEATNNDDHKTHYCLTVGVSKQHPMDIVHNKRIATESARLNAITDPIIVMYDIPADFSNYAFKAMISVYASLMDLDFVKTVEEKKKIEAEEFKKEWAFYLDKQ